MSVTNAPVNATQNVSQIAAQIAAQIALETGGEIGRRFSARFSNRFGNKRGLDVATDQSRTSQLPCTLTTIYHGLEKAESARLGFRMRFTNDDNLDLPWVLAFLFNFVGNVAA